MRKQKSLKLNFIMNAILTMSAFIFPLITFPYVSRILLPVGIGKVSFATSVISYFALFAQLGIPTYGIRACAQVRDDREKLTRTVQEIFIINIVMSIFTYIFFAIALFIVPRLQQDKILFVIVSLTIFLNTVGFEWLYKALEQYTYITIRSIIFKFVALLAMFVLVHKKSDYIIYGGISIFAASASNILNAINIHKYIDIKPVGNYNIKRHLKPVIVFFAMACATTIYTQLDTVMLGFMTTDTDVGYYNAAVKIKIILVSIVTSLGTVLLPRASYYVDNGFKEEFLRISQKAINFVMIVATPLLVYFTFFAREGIIFLSGNAFVGAIIPMQIIMPTLLLIGLTNIMGIQMLVPLGKENMVLYSEIAGAVTNLILNTLLIPRMAASGAAIGTLVAEVVVWLVQYGGLRNTVLTAYKRVHYGFILLALVLASAASVWVKTLSFNTLRPSIAAFVVLVISAVLFFGIYLLTLTLAKESLVLDIEKQVIGKVVSKIRKR
ncbi:O-antigen/teichoic acid export membrane protein [Muricomes intestini]|uniref:O-antigen/teichoic acid export membrane protein n=1 Tax=Muricomes intestini TaxID=1796634 RepID=A0A4R3K2F5_9FIRM|nr:flippase [Muricomes intestini]TCS76627.1 O-antigen/teichoic acid export membrane protein [Muricomes intestini]